MRYNKSVPLSEIQEQTLIGLMLGDGFLYRKDINNNTILRVCRKIQDIDYLKYEVNYPSQIKFGRGLQFNVCHCPQ